MIYHLWALCSAQQINSHSVSPSPIPYDTIFLKKGYRLIFSTTVESRLLRLIGPNVDTVISKMNIKSSEKELGWMKADYDDYFVLYVGYDEEWPWIRIFKKEKGELVLQGRVLDFDTMKNIVLYVDVQNQRKLGLFDINKKQIELFNPPNTPCGFWWQCLYSKSISEKELTLEYAVLNGKREKKVYIR